MFPHPRPKKITLRTSVWYGFGLLFFVSLFAPEITIARNSARLSQGNFPIAKHPAQKHPQLLEYGKPIEGEIAGGQTQSYLLRCAAGQLLHAVVEQQGIDLVATLFGPDGSRIIQVDSPNGKQGPEPVWAITEISGDYRLEIRSEANVPAGRYIVRIEDSRAASPEDRNRVPGEWALQEAKLFLNQRSWQMARAKYGEALKFFKLVPDTSSKAEALYGSGRAHYSLQENASALECFNRALPIYQKLTERIGEANTLYAIGLVHDALHQNLLALEALKQALPIYHQLGNFLGKANTHNLIGRNYDLTGDKERALRHFDEALQLAQSDVSEYGRLVSAGILVNIGGVYANLGYLDQALVKYNEALPILEGRADRLLWATVLNNIGQIYNVTGKPDEALRAFETALTIHESQKDSSDKATLLNNIGYAYFAKSDIPRALHYYNRALTIWQGLDDRASEARMFNNIGQAIASRSREQEALEYYERARSFYQEKGDKANEVAVLGNIGTFYESLGEKDRALAFYEKGIDLLRSLREASSIEEIRASISESSSPFVFKATDLLMSRGDRIRAFDLTEIGRARTLLDRLGNMRPYLLNITNPQLIKDSQDLESRLSSLEHELEQNTELQSHLEIEYAAAQHQFEDLIVRLQLADPDRASRSVATLVLREIQGRLSNDTTLLSYFVLPDKILAFVITRNSFRSVVLPVNEVSLAEKIRWFRSFPTLRDPKPETLKELYAWLIAPVRQYIKTRMVGIIPHKELHYLPFATLTDGRHYFGDQHTLFYLPSASALPFIRKNKPGGAPMFALAHSQAPRLPQLHSADKEANTVAALYNAQALTAGNATRSEFLKRAGEYSVIHIAAHAEVNTSSPLFYRIWLGADGDSRGMLTVREIYKLNLAKTNLVVLSACKTELGKHSLGDDIVALSRAFISAGASTVIASLWSVDDEATGILMRSFYTHLKQGMSKAAALREAQRETRTKYPHPYYWAAFVLSGDP
jgi:CHAT domain-containing protein/predicted negative regulator of RcsB-dependent stress response